MPLKLKPAERVSPFSWDDLPGSSPSQDVAALPSPPTAWLPARDMKLYGAHPLTSTSEIGLVKCTECDKPILRSFMAEHAVTCATVRASAKKAVAKGKVVVEVDDPKKASKKRKASPEPVDLSQPPKKKTKPIPKITKGRMKGPVDLDQQCCVINDKGLPCSRSLTCKSHSMGAKRAVEGRSRKYDDLLLEWQRKHNPNFVEPVRRETKAEKKEKKEKEKLEKKKLADEQAAALGIDPAATVKKPPTGTKKSGKKGSGGGAVRVMAGDDANENLDDLDSEAELDELVQAVRDATRKGVIGVPLAVPCDAGSWFVQRRERLRCCRDLLVGALSNGNGSTMPLGMGLAGRGGLQLGRG
ncbi:SCA7, zinc-binding domain-containing protein [Mycena amicta]|nr:SCA7, zinc-binding domain-containing protein [Mycena amicta]